MKKLLALLLAATMLLGLAACGSPGSAESEPEPAMSAPVSEAPTDNSSSLPAPASDEPVYGGNATVLYGDDLIQYFDPAMGDNRTYSIWMENLFAYDWGANKPENAVSMYTNYTYYDGQIAESYEVDYDAETVTVKIRDDVCFQDKSVAGMGDYDIFHARKVTASDVAYSYQRLLGIDGVTATTNTEMPWEMLLPAIESIEVVDDLTCVFHIPALTEVQLDALITAPVNITGPEWDELTAEQQNDWHYAVGTGPYILTDFQLNASMSFVKSENYYDYDERNPENKLPYLDTVKFVEISDSSNILTQFISGQLDIISFGNDLMNVSEMQQLRDTLGEGNYIEMRYESTPGTILSHYNLENNPMSDRNVRIAMQHAIDVETITKAINAVEEVELRGMWASTVGWDSGTLAAKADEFTYDPDLARQMLADAGYADGFEITYYTKNSGVQAVQMVAQYLNQVGIKLNIEVVADTSERNAHMRNSEELCAFGGNAGEFALKFASMAYFPDGPDYGMFVDNPEWDELCAKIKTATSLEEQAEIARKLDEIWVTEHYGVFSIGCGETHNFYSSKMGGVTGEQFCCNNNTRIMIARLWSTTGE
ncbi:MAG: ABC transporter substrate-binding protein [Oscillospiraceae bacterium]|nr:ABC transporter substrate-binding protein [Oscillospiraceae bacterium]